MTEAVHPPIYREPATGANKTYIEGLASALIIDRFTPMTPGHFNGFVQHMIRILGTKPSENDEVDTLSNPVNFREGKVEKKLSFTVNEGTHAIRIETEKQREEVILRDPIPGKEEAFAYRVCYPREQRSDLTNQETVAFMKKVFKVYKSNQKI